MNKEQKKTLKKLTAIYTKNIDVSKLTLRTQLVAAFPMIRYSLDENTVAIYYCEPLLSNETGTIIDLMEYVPLDGDYDNSYSEDHINYEYLLEQTRELTKEEFDTFANKILDASLVIDELEDESYYEHLFRYWFSMFHDKMIFNKHHNLSTT